MTYCLFISFSFRFVCAMQLIIRRRHRRAHGSEDCDVFSQPLHHLLHHPFHALMIFLLFFERQ